jgi:hypothetical protein
MGKDNNKNIDAYHQTLQKYESLCDDIAQNCDRWTFSEFDEKVRQRNILGIKLKQLKHNFAKDERITYAGLIIKN